MPEGYTALVSLPTGGGKSLITQAMAYQKNDGLTITVVPTVSLAMDQVRVARDNIRVASKAEIACYYSDLASEEKRSIIDRIKEALAALKFSYCKFPSVEPSSVYAKLERTICTFA